MNFALFFKSAGLVFLVVNISACSIAEQLIPAAVEEPQSVDNTLAAHEEPAASEIKSLVEYYKEIKQLSLEEISLEREKVLAEHQLEPSDYTRFKYGLVLLSGKDEDWYKEAVSLLSEDLSQKGDRSPYWQLYSESVASVLDDYVSVEERQKQLNAGNDELRKKNQELVNALARERRERVKLANQLKELKSIETSIIERDIKEDVTIP